LHLDIASLDLSDLDDYDEEVEESILPEIIPQREAPEISVEDREDLKHLDGVDEIPILSKEAVEILEELAPWERIESPVEIQALNENYRAYTPFFARKNEDFSMFRRIDYNETGAALLEEFAELVPASVGDFPSTEGREEGDEEMNAEDLGDNGPIIYENGVYLIRKEAIPGPVQTDPGFRALVESVLAPFSRDRQ
jgi:hypothetical protein